MTVMSKASVSNPASNSVVTAHIVAPLAIRQAALPMMLAFHELSSDAAHYRYELSCGQFEEHLRLAGELCGSTEYKAPLILSFDDGHISNYTHALPLLEKYSCKAIFFVIVGRIGQHKDFMTWAHLRELVSLGHRVQSHSWSHKFLTDCSKADLREELARSKGTLEACLGAPVEALSAPHGRWDRRVLKACASAEYRHVYTSDPWLRPCVIEEVEVAGRLVMVQSMDANRLLSWLTMGRAEAGLHRAKNALKRSARGVLGSKLYYRLWKRFSGWDRPDDTYLNGNQ